MRQLYHEDEKILLYLLKNNSQQAFEQLYQQYSSPIYGKILRLTRSSIVADELLQDTFVKVWEKRHLIDEQFPFKSWLYRVAENEVYQFYRRLARDKKLQEHIVSTFVESYSQLEKDIFLKESRELLNKAMDQLPSQCRQVFTLCRLEGKSYEETGNILGISPFTVSNHLVKASKILRKQLLHLQAEQSLLVIALVTSFILRKGPGI